MRPDQRQEPRTFFLNENHELSREERSGGGGAPKLAPIDWAQKTPRLTRSLSSVGRSLEAAEDPLAGHRYFFLAVPERSITKRSSDPKKAPTGEYEEVVHYSGEHSSALHRIGLDLLGITDQGNALVHATKERFDRLASLASRLPELGIREQSRWSTIHDFGIVPATERVDSGWVDSLEPKVGTETVIELQPLLTRVEADRVVRKVLSTFRVPNMEKIRAVGFDFSGRIWFRCALLADTIKRIAGTFFSIQSIHPPLTAPISMTSRPRKHQTGSAAASQNASATTAESSVSTSLPSVGILDGGVPDAHLSLAPYRRGTFINPDSLPYVVGDHGSLVTSRAVFGDLDLRNGLPNAFAPAPRCKFLDIRVAYGGDEIHEKAVAPSIESCVGAYPDVRTFNLSFGDRRPLDQYTGVERRERMILMQDLDNLVFARDIVVIVAAGNSVPGQVPIYPYPEHHKDPDWKLGNWAQTFNTLTCGSFVDRPRIGGVVQHAGGPSPFCKIGPGIANIPVPDLSEHGGDVCVGYTHLPGLGVFACNGSGLWEDHTGTSFAAPILAQRCALLLQELQGYCPQGTRPFGVTVKALMALSATKQDLPSQYDELASRTLGHGQGSQELLQKPSPDTAVFVWQGILENEKELVRIQFPVPLDWITNAEQPILQLFISWDTPVNAAVPDIYGCRNIIARLRPGPDARAVMPKKLSGNRRYPLCQRIYDLKRVFDATAINGDIWLLELLYDQIADYYVGLDFTPQQRVGLACQLVDIGSRNLSPQRSIQALPIAKDMVRLSVVGDLVRTPVILRTH